MQTLLILPKEGPFLEVDTIQLLPCQRTGSGLCERGHGESMPECSVGALLLELLFPKAEHFK